jgi:hypothetical protein
MSTAGAEPNEPIATNTSVICRHLRSKGMYVYTDATGEGESHDEYDNTVYWCFQTMKDFGPDDGLADRQSCCDPSRACYQAI